MESRSSWQGCSCCFQVITVAVMLVAIWAGYARAQSVPSAGTPEKDPSATQGDSSSGSALSQLHPSDLKAGIFWGIGRMSVVRDVAPGPASVAVLAGGGNGPAFAGFKNRSETSLNDTFLAVEWGCRWSDKLFGTISLDTNIGRQTQFTQTSSASPGQTDIGGNPALGVLFLPDNTKGVITLDDNKRIWNLEPCVALRVMPKLELLGGWKFSWISSSLDPYSAGVPANTFRQLPNITNWRNFWANSVPSATSFKVSQRLWLTGPSLGMRLTSGIPQIPRVQWHVEGKVVPYAWGNYKFDWKGSYADSQGYSLGGQQTTNTGLHGYILEAKGGTQIKLIGRLSLDVWAKYAYLSMKGSGPETQSFQSNFTPVPALSQEAHQSTAINMNSWGLGANLVLGF